MVADSIEDLYTNFKIFVDGFCNQNTTKNENILIYVDVFTGEIYYYTTTMDENE